VPPNSLVLMEAANLKIIAKHSSGSYVGDYQI
jgi:hypothetical protein